MRSFQALRAISISFLALLPTTAPAQSLDQKAYDAVWDKLKKILPANTPSEQVHALTVIVPATWAKQDEESLIELQNIAGAIPPETFSIDPGRMKRRLHKIYSDYVLDVNLPNVPPEQQAKFDAASKAYDTILQDYWARLDIYNTRWIQRVADLERRKDPVTARAKLRFRKQYGRDMLDVQNRLDTAARALQAYAPAASQYGRAVRAIREEITGAQSDQVGTFDYDGGFATLDAIKNDCTDDGNGWDEIEFKSSMSSQETRSSNWNGNGSWGGSFFSIGGGGGSSDYSNVVKTANDSVALRFCNLTYVSLGPGSWWDADLLQAIDRGALTLKADSPMKGKLVFGPDGQIPRIVKGAVVARRVLFMAQLDETNLNEFRKNSGGSGGVRIGPFSIGGGGGSTQFRREYNEGHGKYGRSTNTDVPVIIAIITEPTVSEAPAPSTPPQ